MFAKIAVLFVALQAVCTVTNAQSLDVQIPTDTCWYFYPTTAPTYAVQGMPFDVFNTYLGFDSACSTKQYTEFRDQLNAVTSSDTVMLMMKSLSRLINYNPLLYYRMNYEIIDPKYNSEKYRFNMGCLIRDVFEKAVTVNGIDTTPYKYVIGGVTGMYLIYVNDVSRSVRPNVYGGVETSGLGRLDTTFYHCARCSVEMTFFGLSTPCNCSGSSTGKMLNCINLSWSRDGNTSFGAGRLFDRIIIKEDSLLIAGRRYIVLTDYYPSFNHEKGKYRYSMGPLLLDGKQTVLEVTSEDVVLDPMHLFNYGEEVPLDLFKDKLNAFIQSSLN